MKDYILVKVSDELYGVTDLIDYLPELVSVFASSCVPFPIVYMSSVEILNGGESNEKSMEVSNESKSMLTGGYSSKKERNNWTLNLVLAASAAVVGSSFTFGYHVGVINAPGSIIKAFINESYFERYGEGIDDARMNFLWGFTVSIFAIGGMIGSFVAGYFASRFGRKKSMLWNNVLAIIGIAFMGCSKLSGFYELLIVGRFITGLNNGINTGLAPLYLTEIAPIPLRGILGTLNQLGIVCGILVSQIFGLSELLGTALLWPVLLSLTLVTALYQLLILPFCPETPSYLLSLNQPEDAKKALTWLRSTADIHDEMVTLDLEKESEGDESKVSIPEIFRVYYLRKPMLIAIVMQLSQQLSGINAVFFYSTQMFQLAGVPKDKSDLVTVGMGVVNVVMTLVSLLLIERLGRRILHLLGLTGMLICSIVLVISLTVAKVPLVSVIAIMLFVVSFQTGPGSIPWFITAELFSQNARTSAVSVAGLVNWSGAFIVGLSYPSLEAAMDGYSFIVFAVLIAIFLIYTFFYVPETKGRNIEDISRSFR